jgi:hypothetical protein
MIDNRGGTATRLDPDAKIDLPNITDQNLLLAVASLARAATTYRTTLLKVLLDHRPSLYKLADQVEQADNFEHFERCAATVDQWIDHLDTAMPGWRMISRPPDPRPLFPASSGTSLIRLSSTERGPKGTSSIAYSACSGTPALLRRPTRPARKPTSPPCVPNCAEGVPLPVHRSISAGENRRDPHAVAIRAGLFNFSQGRMNRIAPPSERER